MFGQPKGLFTISSTEMWERFSFYTMQYSLVLYAAAPLIKGGLAMSDAKALQITGLYGGLVYATPILGGFLADKFIGRVRAVHLGGILMAIGHFILAYESLNCFYYALFFLAIGCGFFKPNITSLVGDLYTNKSDSRREAGYNIFYSAINIGALFSGFLGGILNDHIGFYASFIAAGICMIVSIANFGLFYKPKKSLNHKEKITKKIEKAVAFSSLSQPERQGVYLFIILTLMNIIWQIAYNQWAGSLNLYAERNTNRMVMGFTIPTLWFESLNSIFIVILSPLFALFYTFLQRKKKRLDLSIKLSLGYFLQGIACFLILPAAAHIEANAHYLASPWYQFFFYLFSTLAELFTMPVMFAAASALAPKGYSGRLTGFLVFIAMSLGAYLAGLTAAGATSFGSTNMFLYLGVFTCIFGFIHIAINKKVNRFSDAAIHTSSVF